MKVNLRNIHNPLSFRGAPFFGISRIRGALDSYPINANPDFQRDRVWTTKQQELFVGHLLEGGAVLPCIINEGPRGDWLEAELLDGKQRVNACLRWCDGEIDAVLWSGQRINYTELDDFSKRICRTSIGLEFAIVNLSRTEALEFYIKLNRGGTPHSEEEIERVKRLLGKES